MRQSRFAESGIGRFSKCTLRERFLQEVDRVVPFPSLPPIEIGD